MRVRRLSSRMNRIKLIQDFVVSLKLSPALALMTLSCYEEVAVEGIRMKQAVESELGEVREYLTGLLEGGDEASSSEVAMKVIERLYEIDLDNRQKMIQVSVSLSLAMSIAFAFISFFRYIQLPAFFPLVFLPLYFLIPGLNEPEVPRPSIADAIASDLEKGCGSIYALKYLGIYERLVVDESEVELPLYFEYALKRSDKRASALMMRKTASFLKDLHSAVETWKAGIKSLKNLMLSMIAMMGFLNFGLCYLGAKIFSTAPTGLIFLLGLVSSILIARQLNCSLQSVMIYLISFSLPISIFGPL